MVLTRRRTLLAVGSFAASAAAWNFPNGVDVTLTSNSTNTCEHLKLKYGNMTIMPTDSEYADENEFSWNAGAWLGPACILTPSTAEQMSCAVKKLVEFATPFAIRGGGHMPIPDAANINSTGILISSSQLTTLELSEDLQTLSVGPGHPWGDVYEFLDTTRTGKMVVGGRYSPVGIPGYLLGGGMSFYSFEYGFSSSNGNVRAYECVLADGSIVTATANNEQSDLYWALQGGGNSFCILTRFDLRTIDSPVISLAFPSYGGLEVKDAYLDSTLNYVLSGDKDVKATVIPIVRWGQNSTEPSYEGNLWYNGNVTKPEIFNDYQGGLLPENNSTALTALTMGTLSKILGPAFAKGGESNGKHQLFHVQSIKATREAMDIVHDVFFDGIVAHGLSNVPGFFAGLAFNPITTSFIAASNNGTGCPQGIPEEAVFWVEEAITWAEAEDSEKIDAFIADINANMTSQLAAIGGASTYIYLNDAEKDQPVFQGYPAENVARLKEIRNKYDPDMIYTNLMPGGFKVALA